MTYKFPSTYFSLTRPHHSLINYIKVNHEDELHQQYLLSLPRLQLLFKTRYIQTSILLHRSTPLLVFSPFSLPEKTRHQMWTTPQPCIIRFVHDNRKAVGYSTQCNQFCRPGWSNQERPEMTSQVPAVNIRLCWVTDRIFK